MNGVTSAVAWLALFLSCVTLVINVRANRQTRRAKERSVWDDEQLLRTAWLQEIEARGQQLLEQFDEVERRLQEQTTLGPVGHPPETSKTEGVLRPMVVATVDPDPHAKSVSQGSAASDASTGDVTEASGVVPTAADITSADESPSNPGQGDSPSPKEGAQGRLSVIQTIHQLADEGYTVADIARRLNKGAGEIELILSLRASNTKD